MRVRLLVLVGLIAPSIGFADSFSTVHDIRLPLALTVARSAIIELPAQVRAYPDSAFRIINSDNVAVAVIPVQERDAVNIMPQATFGIVTPSANTVPKTSVDMLRDGRGSTYFQPVVGRTVTVQMRFPQERMPTELRYHLTAGTVEHVVVRRGTAADDLRKDFDGFPSGGSVQLSGELATFFEVTLTVREGVVQINELELLEPRRRLLFRAVPQQQYRLLYGADRSVARPEDRLLYQEQQNAISATVGPARAAGAAETGDHDGVDDGDNCPALWNPEQKDFDKDGIGDECDNCMNYSNADQIDSDGNGIGNGCDDTDGDGVVNAVDNCPTTKNPNQSDEDLDGVGNLCDHVDSRFTADKPWMLWGAMALIIVVLAGVGALILRRTKEG